MYRKNAKRIEFALLMYCFLRLCRTRWPSIQYCRKYRCPVRNWNLYNGFAALASRSRNLGRSLQHFYKKSRCRRRHWKYHKFHWKRSRLFLWWKIGRCSSPEDRLELFLVYTRKLRLKKQQIKLLIETVS